MNVAHYCTGRNLCSAETVPETLWFFKEFGIAVCLFAMQWNLLIGSPVWYSCALSCTACAGAPVLYFLKKNMLFCPRV